MQVLNLGTPKIVPNESIINILDDEFIRKTLPERKADGNKGDFGKLLMVCGSYGMAGACILSAKAALRSGVGLLYLLIDKRIYGIISSQVTEAVCIPVNMENQKELRNKIKEAMGYCTACVLGCGLGTLRETLCKEVISQCRIPLLVDADGINFLSEHTEMIPLLPKETVITPHPGEMSRLIKIDIPEIQNNRIKTAENAARYIDNTVVLKGAGTVIADSGGKTSVNPTGNQGMAKGGSGDVLSGIIGALMAQGIRLFDAACAGVYLHGAAGDLCRDKLSSRGMLPTDIIEALPEIYKSYE